MLKAEFPNGIVLGILQQHLKYTIDIKSSSLFLSGLHHHNVFKPILEGREVIVQSRRKQNFDSLGRFRGKNLGSRHLLCKRQKQVRTVGKVISFVFVNKKS
jgi:hypothetical protein